MTYYIVIRESRKNDTPAISEVVRGAYTSNVLSAWGNALFNEYTYQLIIMLSATLFILLGIPLVYCIVSVPMVLLAVYLAIYASFLMKSAQLLYEKRAEKCWVAEVYEPFFFNKSPSTCWYKVITENEMEKEGLKPDKHQRKIVGTVAVMKHNQKEDWAWLFRLAVDKNYRRKGVATNLVAAVKEWCRDQKYDNLEAAIGECNTGSRQMFNETGFQMVQIYHKKLFAVFNLQMFQLRCEVRSTFH